MDVIGPVLLTALVIFVAVMAMRQGSQNRGKTYEQRREETYQRYEQRMEEFKKTELKERDSSERE